MQWFRNGRADRIERPRTRLNAFRPEVESLDGRCLPSASSVIVNGGLTQVLVDSSSDLVVVSPNGQQQTFFNGTVRTAQGFRTPGGALGIDVVFNNGSALQYDPTAGALKFSNTAFGGNILGFATAYSAAGQLRIDILVASSTSTTGTTTTGTTALGQTGSVLQFTPSAGLRDLGLGDNVRWVNTYQDTAGNTGIAVGQEIGNDELLVRKADSAAGVTTLYDGLDEVSAAITGYTQTVSSFSSNNPAVVIDITFNGDTSLSSTVTGTYALQFTSGSVNFSGSTGTGVTLVGTGSSIMPGG